MNEWEPLIINGKTIDLDHLKPLDFDCPIPGGPGQIPITARFSNHCFTETFDPAIHPAGSIIMDGNKQRAFDQVRYDLSKNLPAMVLRLPTTRVYQTWEVRNYLYFEAIALQEDREYRMFFTLRRGNGPRLDLSVESAYSAQATKIQARGGKIRFSVLAAKVLKGEKITFAPR